MHPQPDREGFYVPVFPVLRQEQNVRTVPGRPGRGRRGAGRAEAAQTQQRGPVPAVLWDVG